MIIIKEAKQVGILYHFTTKEYLPKILRDRGLIGDRDWISFSRSIALTTKEFKYKTVQLIFDGNKLSEKYKIEPFLDKIRSRQDEEQEERVLIKSGKVLKCLDCLIEINIKIVDYEEYNAKFDIDKILKKHKIKFNYVDSFKMYKN